MTDGIPSRHLSAIAFVRDIKVSKRFYTEVLGLAIETDFGTNVGLQGGTALWELDPNHILSRRLGSEAIGNRSVNRFEFYLESDDIEAVCARARAHGAEFLHELQEEPWGQRTVRFFDPDRHLIDIGERMETVVQRLHNAGMTLEQVSQKTAMPLALVVALLAAR